MLTKAGNNQQEEVLLEVQLNQCSQTLWTRPNTNLYALGQTQQLYDVQGCVSWNRGKGGDWSELHVNWTAGKDWAALVERWGQVLETGNKKKVRKAIVWASDTGFIQNEMPWLNRENTAWGPALWETKGHWNTLKTSPGTARVKSTTPINC